MSGGNALGDRPTTAVSLRALVPCRNAVSGRMLLVVPATIWPIEMTAGSKTSTRRVIAVWSAVTISAAMTIASIDRCGDAAWPPRPWTVIRSVSLEASWAPPRIRTVPWR